ncbi:hypothetical protein OOU_Y34scaffold00153g1 [Pyricularia oryzae Y34]|uniref:Uncharacterized protein n=2 Tax=Pyricularia oryzae TaxID=318829 RepID=A0AA97P829_PYRO3|nr:hypothetical protein OOU_Y34scaffold00153g1 [Pyricularia oryzae Y34]
MLLAPGFVAPQKPARSTCIGDRLGLLLEAEVFVRAWEEH